MQLSATNISKKITAAILAVLITLTCLAASIIKPNTEANANILYSDDYDEFLYALGKRESGNNYSVRGKGYYGRWQLGKYALIEVGLINSNGQWTTLAASYGVTGISSFLASEACQDYAILELHRKDWQYLKRSGMQSYIGKSYKGLKITMAGLIVAAHLAGPGAAAKAIKSGSGVSDGNGVSIYSYMKAMGGYDIEATITGRSTSSKSSKQEQTVVPAGTTKPVVDKTEETTNSIDNSNKNTAQLDLLSEEELSDISVFGDVNNDGTIDSVDATEVLRYYAMLISGDKRSFSQWINDEFSKSEETQSSEESSNITDATVAATVEPDSIEAATITSDAFTGEGLTDPAINNVNGDASQDETLGNDISGIISVETESVTEDATEATTETGSQTEKATDGSVDNPSLGDVNLDGVIDSRDATLMLRYFAQKIYFAK